MDSRYAVELLKDPKTFEQVFRSGGSVETEVTRGEGENEVTTIEQHEYSFNEYLGTTDATWMFPRVTSNVLLEAAEPVQVIVPLLNVVRVNTGIRTVDYQAFGAIQAHEIAEGAPYPEEQATWARGAKTAKVTKKGLKVPITQEMIDDSLFDVVSMYMRAAGRAMARYKEQKALARFNDAAFEYKNTGDYTGRDRLGALNNTLDYMDILDTIGMMLASGRTPNTIIMHPLAWTMWLDQPLFKNLEWVNAGTFLPSAGTAKLTDGTPVNGTFAAVLQGTAPFGIRVITSPYVPYDTVTKATDVYVIDSNDVGVLTVREDMSVDNWDDPERDIVSMKVKERYDITMMETEGYNIVSLKNVIVDRNYGSDVTFTKEIS
jgi:hypothetical protein